MLIQGYTDKEGNSIIWKPSAMFLSPDGNSFSNKPFTKDQKKIFKQYNQSEKVRDRVIEHLQRTGRSISEETQLVKEGKSTLPRYAQDFLLKQ